MTNAQQTKTAGRCTLCPAGCELSLVSSGPDTWHTEFPTQNVGGVCPRGAALAQILTSRKRLVSAGRRTDGKLSQIDLEAAAKAIVADAGDRPITILLDANVPIEEMLTVSAWCKAWPQAKLCTVVEPAEEQALLGVAASGAATFSNEDLAACDGFLIIGDAFAANPTCARAVFDVRHEAPRTPVVVIDAAAGGASKFASVPVTTPVGMELAVLSALAKAADVDVDAAGDAPSALAAGKALSACKKLGIILSAEYGRSNAWRQIGYLAGQIARKLGGGVAVQTTGANAAAAVALAGELGSVPLAQALSDDSVKVTIGGDVLGMLGLEAPAFKAAATPFVNRTAESAEIVLPVAVAAEIGGSYLLSGKNIVSVDALLAPPAGVPTPSAIVAMLGDAAGVSAPEIPSVPKTLNAPKVDAPGEAPESSAPFPALLIGREAMHAGAGALTSQATWQQGTQPQPDVRISPEDMKTADVKNEAIITVSAGDATVQARVQTAPELAPGLMVLSDGHASARSLVPSVIDGDVVLALPQKGTLNA